LFLSASFFGLFEATLSTSVTTGYNWATTSEAAKSEQVQIKLKLINFEMRWRHFTIKNPI